jgi:hypothetical protein
VISADRNLKRILRAPGVPVKGPHVTAANGAAHPSKRSAGHQSGQSASSHQPVGSTHNRSYSATCLDRRWESGDLGFSGAERAGSLANRLPSPWWVFWLRNGSAARPAHPVRLWLKSGLRCQQLVTGNARIWSQLESGGMVRARVTVVVPEAAVL